MAANRRRGEVAAHLDGRERRLRLTLGALTELEQAFAVDDLAGLATRFSTGKLAARDIARIIGAGLRGAGESVSDDDVLAMRCDGGVQQLAGIVADLLAETFGTAAPEPAARP